MMFTTDLMGSCDGHDLEDRETAHAAEIYQDTGHELTEAIPMCPPISLEISPGGELEIHATVASSYSDSSHADQAPESSLASTTEGHQVQGNSLPGEVSELELNTPDDIALDTNSLYQAATLVPTQEKPAQIPSLPLKESLGLLGCTSIFVGSLGAFAILGFLTFLWFGYGAEPEARGAASLWRILALRGWMVQTVTLCSLFLRFIASAQSTVSISMVAALVMENELIRKSNVAHISVARCVNDGPYRLLQSLIRPWNWKILLRSETWLLSLLAILTLALQFSSTILLSDLHTFPVAGDTSPTSVKSLLLNPFDPTSRQSGREMAGWTPVYAVFGEVEPSSHVAPDGRGFSDSGLLQRGFLPLMGSSNRASVRFFKGNAIVMNSRTACMRPVIDLNFTSATTGDDQRYGVVRGTVHLDTSLYQATVGSESILCDSDNCQMAAFGCYIPGNTDGRWKSSFCRVTEVGGPTYSFDTLWDPSQPPWVQNSSIYLAFETNMDVDNWAAVSQPILIDNGKPFNEWNSYELLAGSIVNVSLCFSAYKMERRSVQMSASGTVWEPTINWTLISSTWDTSSMQVHFGLDSEKQHFEERGVLNMTIVGDPEDGSSSSPANDIFPDLDPLGRNTTRAGDTEIIFDELVHEAVTTGDTMNQTYHGCENCIINGVSFHREVNMLWEDIVTSTGRVADALQTLVTIVASTVYEKHMQSFGETEEVMMATTKLVLIPGRCDIYGCAGFIAVTALLAAQLLCVAVVTVMYAKRARYSRYGNVWQAVSQIISRDMAGVLEMGNSASDKEVNFTLRDQTQDGFVRLQRSDETGRVEVVQYSS
ncbi:hypothetical protein F4802DRAFT_554392 [Xylaria palmicola]|nr:hypothetical protein F4802DRAFT_554392 [Xylaria palmicola]